MIVTLIAAVAENRVIGKDNDLIWHLPDDMKFFKGQTLGHHVIMGRKNYESIPEKFRPLPKRTNVVITRDPSYRAEKAIVVHQLRDALSVAEGHFEKDAFIIGGGQIYDLALKEGIVHRMLITHVHQSFDGDTFFPEVDYSSWQSRVILEHPQDEKHAFSFTIKEYLHPSLNF